jgi:hypothetical protein
LDPVTTISDRIKEYAKTTAPGTCEWIFKEPEFEAWSTRPDIPILWIYGQSGAGKSHLAANIVKHFGPSHLLGDKDTTKATIAAYFCEYIDAEITGDSEDKTETPNTKQELKVNLDGKDDELAEKDESTVQTAPTSEDPVENITATSVQGKGGSYPSDKEEIMDDPSNETIAGMLRTLCWQLSVDDKKYEKDITDHLTAIQNNAGPSSALSDVWKYLFRNNYFTTLQGRFVTLVIDGVDNLDPNDRTVLYNFFTEIVQVSKAGGTLKESGSVPVKFIVLSQPRLKEEIVKVFPLSQISSITITKDKNRDDIERFISWTVGQSPKLSRALKEKSFQLKTVSKIAESTGGVFES